MISRFDHAVIAVRDLDEAARRYRDLGFDVSPGGRHTGRGTHNAIIRFGLDYLELISVYDEAEVRATGGNREVILDSLRKYDNGLLGYALATTNIEADAERFLRTGLDAEGPFAMQRERPDGRLLSWRLLVPGGVQWRRPWPFLIQWDAPDDERLSWERPGKHSNGVSGVAGVRVAVKDLDAAADLYERQLGLGRGEAEDGRAVFSVEDFRIELVSPAGNDSVQTEIDERGEGPFSLLLRAADPARARDAISEPFLRVQAGKSEGYVDSVDDSAKPGGGE